MTSAPTVSDHEDVPRVLSEIQAERRALIADEREPQRFADHLLRRERRERVQRDHLRHDVRDDDDHDDRPEHDRVRRCYFLASSSRCLHSMQYRACGSASRRSKAISLPQLWHLPNVSGDAVEPAERLVDVPEEPTFLAREQERLLPLHRVGALVGHVERVRAQVAVAPIAASSRRSRHSGPSSFSTRRRSSSRRFSKC